MLEKLSRNARKTMEKQQVEAMQHYLNYLKGQEEATDGEEKPGQTRSHSWRSGAPVMYPPFED